MDVAAGDARTAIGILRTAARYAYQDNLGEITREVMTEAKAEIHRKASINSTLINRYCMRLFRMPVRLHQVCCMNSTQTKYRIQKQNEWVAVIYPKWSTAI